MAGLEIDFPDDFLSDILDMNTEELCKEMVDSAVPVVEESLKKEMQKVISHPGDSELVQSVKASRAKMTKTGAVISFVSPRGNSKNYYYRSTRKGRKIPVSNVLKAIWLNYGRQGQPAKPFLTKAINNVSEKAVNKMQETYNRLTGGGNGS